VDTLVQGLSMIRRIMKTGPIASLIEKEVKPRNQSCRDK